MGAVHSGLHAAPNVEPCGIGHGDAGGHQLRGLSALIAALRLRQMRPVVDAERLFRVRRAHAGDLGAALGGQRHDLREVVLALGVVRRHRVEQFRQQAARRRQGPGIDLADRPLRQGCVPFFHDAGHLAPFAQNSRAEPVRARPLGGDEGDAVGRLRHAFPQRVHAEQRHVAEQHEHGRIARNERQRLRHGMAGATLRRLENPGNINVSVEVSLHFLAAVADHHVNAARFERGGGVQHMRKQRTPGQGMQHLRQPRAHSRPGACCQHDHFQRHSPKPSPPNAADYRSARPKRGARAKADLLQDVPSPPERTSASP